MQLRRLPRIPTSSRKGPERGEGITGINLDPIAAELHSFQIKTENKYILVQPEGFTQKGLTKLSTEIKTGAYTN